MSKKKKGQNPEIPRLSRCGCRHRVANTLCCAVRLPCSISTCPVLFFLSPSSRFCCCLLAWPTSTIPSLQASQLQYPCSDERSHFSTWLLQPVELIFMPSRSSPYTVDSTIRGCYSSKWDPLICENEVSQDPTINCMQLHHWLNICKSSITGSLRRCASIP